MSRRRGYRELQADAARGTVSCPHCHTTFVPGEADRAAAAPKLPDGFPVLSSEQLAARVVEHEPATARLHEALRERVADATFHLWLAPLRLVGAAGDTLFVVVPDEIVSWVRDRFEQVLEAAASTLAGRPVRVVVAPMGGSS